MVRRASTKLRQMGSKNRYYLYLKSELALDSRFPFELGEDLINEIRGETIVTRRARKGET